MRLRAAMIAAAILISALILTMNGDGPETPEPTSETPHHSTPTVLAQQLSELPELPDTILRLTEDDFRQVAEKLGVEPASIKAVVEIEAGPAHKGFSAPGKPLINFDLTMFRRFATKRGVNLSKYSGSHSVVFNSHQGSQDKANRRLEAAKTIHNYAAVEGTFWGMFQIGGFNWDKCGCENIDDFVMRMSRSERDQLDMFAEFIKNAGLLKYLRDKDWAAFARGYNGPSYARRNYHTRMASAYAKYKGLKDTAYEELLINEEEEEPAEEPQLAESEA